jgi:hypothetical protein
VFSKPPLDGEITILIGLPGSEVGLGSGVWLGPGVASGSVVGEGDGSTSGGKAFITRGKKMPGVSSGWAETARLPGRVVPTNKAIKINRHKEKNHDL